MDCKLREAYERRVSTVEREKNAEARRFVRPRLMLHTPKIEKHCNLSKTGLAAGAIVSTKKKEEKKTER